MPASLLTGLRNLGYAFSLDGTRIRFAYQGRGSPPEDRARPLLIELSERKSEVITALQKEERLEHSNHDDEPNLCWVCGSRRFWISINGAKACPVCHPPAYPGLIKEWVGVGDDQTKSGEAKKH